MKTAEQIKDQSQLEEEAALKAARHMVEVSKEVYEGDGPDHYGLAPLLQQLFWKDGEVDSLSTILPDLGHPTSKHACVAVMRQIVKKKESFACIFVNQSTMSSLKVEGGDSLSMEEIAILFEDKSNPAIESKEVLLVQMEMMNKAIVFTTPMTFDKGGVVSFGETKEELVTKDRLRGLMQFMPSKPMDSKVH